MEVANYYLFSLAIIIFMFLLAAKFVIHRIFRPKNFPPSPPSRPIIGHLHLLKQPIHRTLCDLSKKYGDILFLRFGTRRVLVVSSPSVVEECFTSNDIIFANRPLSLAGKHLNYNSTTMGFSSYGDHWRSLRRLTTIELFSTSRVNSFAGIRKEEVQLLLKQLFQDSRREEPGNKVELTSKFMELTFNVVMRMIAGKRYYGTDVVDHKEARQFQEIIKEMESLRGSSNINDFFPVLQWVDFGGLEKRMVSLMKKMDSFLQDLIEKHRRPSESGKLTGVNSRERNLTLIDVMLSLKEAEPEFYTDQTIKGVIMTTLTAGTQTSAATLEWAMSLLLNHPEAIQKAFSEIDTVVGTEHIFDETDATKLNYLQNIINETFRLFPPAPLLLPHESSKDCSICGYHVPRGSMLLVNTWSINRDPKLWVEPTKFMPERFEVGEGIEGYKLLPFGAGRRACPGAGLAKRVISLTLGALIQCFEWKRVGKEEIDLTEGTGLTMPKVEPLEAICSPRQPMIHLLSSL